MFSSDRNIGIIGRLVELARHYFGLQCEYIKLGAIEKSVRLITALVIVAVLALIIIMTLIFFSLAATVWLSDCIGYAGAFCVVGHSIWLPSYCSSYSENRSLSVRW